VPAKDAANSDAPQQVLLAPGQVFKCQNGGKITFTDRPCPTEARQPSATRLGADTARTTLRGRLHPAKQWSHPASS
jgi:hypothetical protein